MKNYILSVILILFGAFAAAGQGTTFNYQGNLTNGGSPANGSFDFEFLLFDALSGGGQIGSTQAVNSVPVTNGAFSVSLNFGPQFPGTDRYLEIRVRPSGQTGITLLSPRQRIGSNPYAIKSLNAETAATAGNALQLGGVVSSQFVLTGDARLSDARPPLPGSTNYVQNGTSRQSSSNFNISGNGTAGGTFSANVVNAESQFNLNGVRILSNAGSNNFFAGEGAASANPTGSYNTFVGWGAGQSNTTGAGNAFFGNDAGQNNIGGNYNAIFGHLTGQANTTGTGNAFFGSSAGQDNTIGGQNTFLGTVAGNNNTSGNSNVFIGYNAGYSNIFGSNNTALGQSTGFSQSDLTYATAIGSGSFATLSNSVFLGRPADTVRIPGGLNVTGSTFLGGVFVVSNGSLATFTGSASVSGNLSVSTLGSAGATALCRNASNQIATCSSSLRYKSGVTNFTPGLDIVNRLRPITFSWLDGGLKDVGFAAEEVNAIEPLLTTYNDKGEIEGVKYAQITTVLVNAVKEQQMVIEKQQKQIEVLTALVCTLKKNANICKER